LSRLEVRFTPGAATDIERANQWYEAERAGLGAEFQIELWRVLDLLVTMPEMGPIAQRDLRRVLLRRFPHAAYYRIVGTVLEIRACLHHREDRKI
jgi:plasmid stabilization system protein ParE